jgi:hypothetical protein
MAVAPEEESLSARRRRQINWAAQKKPGLTNRTFRIRVNTNFQKIIINQFW